MNKIKILIPVYNDWQSVFKLIENINSEVSKLEGEFSIIIVNDASTESRLEFSSDLSNFKQNFRATFKRLISYLFERYIGFMEAVSPLISIIPLDLGLIGVIEIEKLGLIEVNNLPPLACLPDSLNCTI